MCPRRPYDGGTEINLTRLFVNHSSTGYNQYREALVKGSCSVGCLWESGYMRNGSPDYISTSTRVSDLMVEMGMVTSRLEFKRKLREGAIKVAVPSGRRHLLRNETLLPSISHATEIRMGMRVLWVAVAGGDCTCDRRENANEY
mgnify:CR=1 FL=1